MMYLSLSRGEKKLNKRKCLEGRFKTDLPERGNGELRLMRTRSLRALRLASQMRLFPREALRSSVGTSDLRSPLILLPGKQTRTKMSTVFVGISFTINVAKLSQFQMRNEIKINCV